MIALIGSGNVATWIAGRLRDSDEFRIGQVYSRHLDNAKKLADSLGAKAIDDLKMLDPACDIFLFALRDDAYPEILNEIPFKMSIALHTAGSVSQHIFKDHAELYGVLYPLQSFSKQTDMSALEVPLFVEGDRLGKAKDIVMRLAAMLSNRSGEMTEEQRKVVHLAAVFACNFSNAMCGIADDILRDHDMSLEVLMPLLQHSLDKLKTMSPKQAQTGPAARGDTVVMGQQLFALKDERLQAIYRELSDYILSQYEEKA